MDSATSTILPQELVMDILYKFKGLEHPVAMLIKREIAIIDSYMEEFYADHCKFPNPLPYDLYRDYLLCCDMNYRAQHRKDKWAQLGDEIWELTISGNTLEDFFPLSLSPEG